MASTNPTSTSRPLHNTATLHVLNPSDGSEAHSSLPESDITYDSSSECDTDDLSMKERILWRAGAISPQFLGMYPKLYSPSAQLALSAENISCHQQEAEELDINYLGILSPPPRVFHNPHPSYNDYVVPDRFSVRTFLEAPAPEDVDKVESSSYYPTLDAHEIGLGVRPPTRALEPIKPLQIHRRTRPDPPTMYRDPTSQSMQPSFSSYSIYSQDSAPHKTSQYCPSLHPLPMRPGGSMTGSGSHRSALSSSHLYCDEPGDYPSSMKTFASVMSAAPPGLAVHRPRRRGPLDADRHGLPLIDEQKESTFTFPDQYPRTELSTPCWNDAHYERLGSRVPLSQSVVPPHPWVSDVDEKRERFPPTTVSQQPGHHAPMSPKRRIGNRNAKHMPYTSDGKRDWSSDLCMFCDHNLGTCEFSVPIRSSVEADRKFILQVARPSGAHASSMRGTRAALSIYMQKRRCIPNKVIHARTTALSTRACPSFVCSDGRFK